MKNIIVILCFYHVWKYSIFWCKKKGFFLHHPSIHTSFHGVRKHNRGTQWELPPANICSSHCICLLYSNIRVKWNTWYSLHRLETEIKCLCKPCNSESILFCSRNTVTVVLHVADIQNWMVWVCIGCLVVNLKSICSLKLVNFHYLHRFGIGKLQFIKDTNRVSLHFVPLTLGINLNPFVNCNWEFVTKWQFTKIASTFSPCSKYWHYFYPSAIFP